MKTNLLSLITIVFSALMGLYWGLLFILAPESRYFYDAFGIALAILPFLGFLIALKTKREWGGWASRVGKTLGYIGLSLILWTIGQSIYVFYTFIASEVPYPGLPDLFWVFIDISYAIALLSIARYSGVKRNIKQKGKSAYMILFFVPLASIYLTYKLFFVDLSYFETFDLTLATDLFYSLGSILVMTLIILTFVFSLGKLGGKMRQALYLLFVGIVFQYLGDISFSIAEATGENYSGSVSDFIYFVSILFVTFGVMRFFPTSLFSDVESSNQIAENQIVKEVVSKIISEQGNIIGMGLAFARAKSTGLIAIKDNDLSNVELRGEPKEIIESLLKAYGDVFGQASIDVSIETLQSYPQDVIEQYLPTSLKTKV